MAFAATVLLQSSTNETIRGALGSSSSSSLQRKFIPRKDPADEFDLLNLENPDIDDTVDDDCNEDEEDDIDEEDLECDDDEEEVAALLELEEEQMMKLDEDDMILSLDNNLKADGDDLAKQSQKYPQNVAESARRTGSDQQTGSETNNSTRGDEVSNISYRPYQYSRGRARTLSIEMDRFDLDDASNILFDGAYIGDEIASISDLPPFLLNKLLSRSRSNSVATSAYTNAAKGTDSTIVDSATSSSIRVVSKSAAAAVSGGASSGVDVSIALQRVRGYSLEFLSFGFNTEEPLPLESPSLAKLDADITPLVSMYQRPRGDSEIYDVSEKLLQRPSGGSVAIDINGRYTRQRGDSIIFDPCSFSDGGIHEQRALLIKGRASSIDSTNEVQPMLMSDNPTRHEFIPDQSVSMNSFFDFGEAVLVSKPISVNEWKEENASAREGNAPECLTGISTADLGVAASSGTVPLSRVTSGCLAVAKMPPSTAGNIIPLNNESGQMMTMPSCLTGGMSVTMEFLNKDGRIGIYLPEERKKRVAKFHLKRKMRIWRKRIKYDCRKKLADSRPRIKGRFVRRSDVESDDVDGMD